MAFWGQLTASNSDCEKTGGDKAGRMDQDKIQQKDGVEKDENESPKYVYSFTDEDIAPSSKLWLSQNALSRCQTQGFTEDEVFGESNSIPFNATPTAPIISL